MKILEVIPQLASGGAERFTVDLCNELSVNNEVTLLTFYPLSDYGFYASELSSNVNLICLDKDRGVSLKTLYKVTSFIKKYKPDVVHLHLRSIIYCLPSIFFSRKIKYYMTIHSDADKEADGYWGRLIRKHCFRRKLVTPITIAPQSQAIFNQYYDVESEMIFNGRNVNNSDIIVSDQTKSEIEACKQTPQDRVIINLARINEVKRQDLLAKVVSRLYNEGYRFTLLIVGNKRDSRLVQKIESYSCPLIHMLGEKSNPLEYLKVSDAYCLCSSYEGLPISLIEAIGTETIPICTPVGGIVDVVTDGYNGILAKGLSDDDLYDALKSFLDLPVDSVERLKRLALETYTVFSMTECANNYLKLFNAR